MDPDRFARGVLFGGALAFAAPGLGFLLAPATFAAVVDLALASPTARSDVRAVFGGLELGIAAALLACALRRSARRAGLALLLLAVGGMLLGRALGIALDGPPGLVGAALTAIEVLLFAAGLRALVRLHGAPSPSV